MSDGMSGWERMLVGQAADLGAMSAELEKLRGFVADYEATLLAMKSAVTRALADVERSARLREALLVVRARIDRTVAASWCRQAKAEGAEKYPGTLLEYVTQVLEENPV